MTKNSKTQFVEDSFVSSDCSIESNFKKWYEAEKERLASRGKDDRFFVYAEPDIHEGIIICADYTMKFNRDEYVIDLVINGEEDSLIWDDVIDKVPARFRAIFDIPDTFLYRISSNTSDKKEFYYDSQTEVESGEIEPVSFDELSPIGVWRVENFDELIADI